MEAEKGPPQVVKEAFEWVKGCNHAYLGFDYSREAWFCEKCGLTINELLARCMREDAQWIKVRACMHPASLRHALKLSGRDYSHCTACGALLLKKDV